MTSQNTNADPVVGSVTQTFGPLSPEFVAALSPQGESLQHAEQEKRPGVVTLDCPIKRGDQLISQVQLRKPDAGSLRGIKLSDLLQLDVGSVMTLTPRISSPTLTSADVAKMDPADLLQLGSEIVAFFLTKAEKASLPA